MKFLVVVEIKDGIPWSHTKELALGVATEMNAIARNNPEIKIHLDDELTNRLPRARHEPPLGVCLGVR